MEGEERRSIPWGPDPGRCLDLTGLHRRFLASRAEEASDLHRLFHIYFFFIFVPQHPKRVNTIERASLPSEFTLHSGTGSQEPIAAAILRNAGTATADRAPRTRGSPQDASARDCTLRSETVYERPDFRYTVKLEGGPDPFDTGQNGRTGRNVSAIQSPEGILRY